MSKQSIQLPDVSATHQSALQAVDKAIALLQREIEKPRFRIPKGENALYLEMRRDLPYVIHDTALAGIQILVNRNYKPLGNSSKTGDGWVSYESSTGCHVRLTSAQIAAVIGVEDERGLFGDASPPWFGKRQASSYLERLKLLRTFL